MRQIVDYFLIYTICYPSVCPVSSSSKYIPNTQLLTTSVNLFVFQTIIISPWIFSSSTYLLFLPISPVCIHHTTTGMIFLKCKSYNFTTFLKLQWLPVTIKYKSDVCVIPHQVPCDLPVAAFLASCPCTLSLSHSSPATGLPPCLWNTSRCFLDQGFCTCCSSYLEIPALQVFT